MGDPRELRHSCRRHAGRGHTCHGRGFTIIEILIGIVFLSIFLVGMLSHIIQTRKGAQATLEEIKAVGYADDLMEWVKNAPPKQVPDSMDVAEDGESFKALGIKDEVSPIKEPNIKRFLSIAKVQATVASRQIEMKKIDVKIEWTVTVRDENAKSISRTPHYSNTTLIRIVQ